MGTKLHPKIDKIMNTYVHEINQQFPNIVYGIYLYGSISMGGLSVSKSDIDFITILNRKLKDDEIEKLGYLHKKIESIEKKPNMNGIYITKQHVGKLPDEVQPFPFYLDGKMYKSGYFELNLITWYELKEFGINVFGPSIETLSLVVDWDKLIYDMKGNLNTYWLNWIKHRRNNISMQAIAIFFNRAEIEWGVLGITRLYYTFRENEIVTKEAAGEYALKNVPKQWHKIVNEALNVRSGKTKSLYWSPLRRRDDALAYMEYIFSECNREVSSRVGVK